MTAGLHIRKATSDDIPGMMLLFSSALAITKSASFFQWWNKFPSITYCAVAEGKLVGMFVVLKRKLINNLSCGVLMGLLVGNAWRGRGLFKQLGDHAMAYFDDIDLFCCLTNQVGKKALEKNFNFRTISNIETMSLAINADNACSDHESTPITTNTRFVNLNRGGAGTIMFLADEEFRQWRYGAHPRYSYAMINADSNEFAVINKYFDKETNLRYGDIVDFETEELDEKSLIDIVNSVVLTLQKDVDIVTIQAVPNSLLHTISKKIGFRESNIKHCFSIKAKEPCNEYLYDSARWLIKWGDYLR